MKWFDLAFRELSENKKKVIMVKGNFYNETQLKLSRELCLGLMERFEKKPQLSLRRSYIVILHELFYLHKEYPKNLDLEKIRKRAVLRFEILNRESRGLTSAGKVHPKDPCLFYEDDARLKAGYRIALQLLLINSREYFKKHESVPYLKSIYEEVNLC